MDRQAVSAPAINHSASHHGYQWLRFLAHRRLRHARCFKCITPLRVLQRIPKLEGNVHERHSQLILGRHRAAKLLLELHSFPIRLVPVPGVSHNNGHHPLLDLHRLVPQILHGLLRSAGIGRAHS